MDINAFRKILKKELIRTLLLTIESDNTALDSASWHYAISDGNFSLPPQLTAIQSEAFNGTPLIIVEIPASVTGIGDRAFAASALLRALLFLNGNVTLGADVLKDSDQAVVICPAGGTVEEWCVRNDVIYVTY
ncbi:MAG: leucine-rich repeat protein [Anaerolineaceae bacterium]|nr:leucine-rich repeat protein [Anaerolineaceae bacterium]